MSNLLAFLIKNRCNPFAGKAAASLQLKLISISEQLKGEIEKSQEAFSNGEDIVRGRRYIPLPFITTPVKSD